jgi:hypothetical protein
MTTQDVKTLINNFAINGNVNHFKIGGNPIKGYIFKRSQLTRLIDQANSKHIFCMWALGSVNHAGSGAYLNLILAGITTDAQGVYRIDESLFIESEQLPYTGMLNLGGGYTSKSNSGYPIPPVDLHAFQSTFINSNYDQHLYPLVGQKIKGAHLGQNNFTDLIILGLINSPTGATPNDEFIFMPVIRSKNHDGVQLDRHYLSIGVAAYANGTLQGQIIEYCLPCPSACPATFLFQ